ncbi:MAG: response regulator [Spirochaetales bacterium]|nr:response regulator [Spirochaetales bacterium]
MQLLTDTANPREIAQVRALTPEHWLPSKKEIPALGYGHSPLWVRFDLENQSAVKRIAYLELAVPWMDRIELYMQGQDRAIPAGDRLPFGQRSIRYRNVVFPVEIAPASRMTMHMRLENEGTMMVPLFLWSPADFEKARLQETVLMGGFFGAGIIILLFNIFVYFSVRDRVYLDYVLHLALILLWTFSFFGYMHQLVIPDYPELAHRLPIFLVACSFAAALSLARSFLGLAQYLPRVDFALRLVQYGLLIFSVPGSLFYKTGSVGVSLGGFLLPLVLLPISVHLLRQGSRPARFFLAAWMAIFAASLIAPLRNAGILPSTWDAGAVAIGTFFQMFLLSLGLGSRINLLRLSMAESRDEVVQLNQAISRFVPEFTHYLTSDLKQLRLGQKLDLTATVLFSDIRGFTNLSTTMTSGEIVGFLNSYYGRLAPVVEQFGGFVDKYIGDSVLAIFPENPDSALRAAIAASYELQAYNEARKRRGRLPVRTCFGIHTGPLTIGNVGTENRMQTTVIGDTVNIAARTEELTKRFFATILLTKNSIQYLHSRDAYSLREIAILKPRGKDENIGVYECYDTDPLLISEQKSATEGDLVLGLAYFYEGRLNEALQCFTRGCQQAPGDPVLVYYLQECQERLLTEKPSFEVRILMIDDNPAVLDLLAVRLTRPGWQVDRAESAVQALRLAGSNHYDLVIMDIHLEDASGYDLIELLREIENMRDAEYMVLTADTSPESIATARAANVAFFAKPAGFKEIIQAIRERYARSVVT